MRKPNMDNEGLIGNNESSSFVATKTISIMRTYIRGGCGNAKDMELDEMGLT